MCRLCNWDSLGFLYGNWELAWGDFHDGLDGAAQG
jgi:hypothetical protein